MPSGAFPKEFRDRAFGKPDKPFVVVFLLALFLLCGLTFILSLREPPAVNEKHIVKIQNRYAKIVLDAFEIEKKKKKRKEIKPEVKKPAQVPKPKIDTRRTKKENKIEVPMLDEIKVKKYEIRKKKIEITESEKEIKIDNAPQLPQVLNKRNSRYGSKQASEDIGLDPDLDSSFNLNNKGPDIDVSRSGRYGGGGGRRSKGLDYIEDSPAVLQSNEPEIDTRTVKRYKSKRGGQGRSGTGSMVADVGERKVLLAKKSPGTKVVVGKRYGGAGYKKSLPAGSVSNSVALKEKDAPLKKSGKTVSLPEMANIQNLEACVDPNEEKMLKKKIVTYVGDESVCNDRRGSYAYLGTEMFSTLEVRFVSSTKRKYNRCEALDLALQCLINKNKR